ncbi:hypothetical protein [Burkholderia ubonensis]|uniref:hypothetical protein n=1 Tax=Burkholderia ubonensis TaxID=101571 RepID=UPI0012F8EF07|nr:hypothetical protein [Burkholderia ubonensis]
MEPANATDTLRVELDKALTTGSYTSMFFDDVFELWTKRGISPEVILRELRALEGLGVPLMQVDGDEPVPIYFTGAPPKDEPDDVRRALPKPDAYLNRSLSATKGADKGLFFDRKNSPLKGLWHKHYYVHQTDFLKVNVENQNTPRQRQGQPILSPILAMMTRLAESSATGEWIVFKKEAERNTYLCLAKHTDGDGAVYDRIKSFI